MVDLPVNGDLIGNGGFNQQYDEQFGFVQNIGFQFRAIQNRNDDHEISHSYSQVKTDHFCVGNCAHTWCGNLNGGPDRRRGPWSSDDSDRIWKLSSSEEEDVQAPPPAPAPPSGRTLSKRTRIHNGPAELDPSRRRHLKPVPGEAGFEQGRYEILTRKGGSTVDK